MSTTYAEIYRQISEIGQGHTVFKPTAAEHIAYLEMDMRTAAGGGFVDLVNGDIVTVTDNWADFTDNWADFAERWAAERDRQGRPVHYVALALAMRRAGFDISAGPLFDVAHGMLLWYWERYRYATTGREEPERGKE